MMNGIEIENEEEMRKMVETKGLYENGKIRDYWIVEAFFDDDDIVDESEDN